MLNDISMDFIIGLPKAWGKVAIMVVVDQMAKCSHFIALSHLFTAKDIAYHFIDEVVRVHGFLQTIVSY